MAYIDNVTNILQIQPDGLPTFVRLSQNENGRNLYFQLAGNEIDIPANSTITISGTKPDGTVYSGTGSITDNVILIPEMIQMTAVAGYWDAKVKIISGGNTIATGRIRFVIDADTVDPDSVPSDSELEGLVAEAQQYAETARTEAYGSPLTAQTAAGMTDHTRVYVYTGSESGYTAGHWYFWNGSAWTDGGIYNSTAVNTDTTLTLAGVAADAKATGDAIEAARVAIDDTLTNEGEAADAAAVGSEISGLKEELQERAEHIDGIVSLDKDNFELGNITINPHGWTYTASSRRVRTKENYDLELEVGDRIRIKDPSKASFYIGYQTTAETYGASGAWVTEWECDYGGKYAFVIKANPEAAQADTSYLLGLLEIVRYNNNQQNIKNLASHNPAIASANHRGMNRNAPENTLPAFQQSKRYGFDYVETDIVWTSDGVPVLLHDSTINRTARNADGTAISDEISIANITYEQALTYDFGIWKAAKWAGTKIPTFEQLLTLCKKQGIKVLAELKSFGYTNERLVALIDMVRSYGAKDLVCWISFENTILATIKNLDAKATLGYISASVTTQTISNAQALKTDANKVILMSGSRSTETIDLCKAANIPLWTYTINNANTMRSLPIYLCGVTSDLYPVNVVWNESAEE